MSSPYVGEIRMFGGNFAPLGWNFCDGSVLAITENETLFNLIGTTYGGDGQQTFALPDLRGRLVVHQGPGYVIGQQGGVETVTLTSSQIPPHTHAIAAEAQPGETAKPGGNYLAESDDDLFVADVGNQAFNSGTVSLAGGSQPHDNQHPFLCVNFIIAMFGVFPSQS